MKRALLCLATLAGLLSFAAHAAEPISLDDLNEEETQEAVDFVIGNAVFVLFHEAGHMLISELGLPVLGREEDAVDALSSMLLLEARDETLDQAITDAADGWFLSSDKAEEAGEDLAFWDSHGLDRQRAYQMVCMMVGHDAEGFKEFADSMDFPEPRREECAYEYERMKLSWATLLESHVTGEGESSLFEITYENTDDAELSVYRDLLISAELLEALQIAIGGSYKVDKGVKFTAKACGEPNAFWHPGERQLTFCYELAQHHMGLIVDWLSGQREAQ